MSRRLGVVCTDAKGDWMGGRYYLHHVIQMLRALPSEETWRVADLWWRNEPREDPFSEVRARIEERVVVSPPRGLARVARSLRRRWTRTRDARDLFHKADISAVFPVLPCSNPGIPFVFWIPDFQYVHLPELFSADLSRWYQNHNTRNVAQADHIVLSSEHARNDLGNVYSDKEVSRSSVVHFCSTPSPEWWREDPEEAAARWDLPERFAILPNQFSHHKNHEVIFEAAAILRERGESITIVCTGSNFGFRGNGYWEGLMRFRSQHSLEESIRTLGFVPRRDYIALLRRSVFVLQPSRFEGWSTVVEDAKALGKRLLVSDIDVHREQVVDYEEAEILPAFDPEAWAAALSRNFLERPPGPDESAEAVALAKNSDTREKYGRDMVAALDHACERFHSIP